MILRADWPVPTEEQRLAAWRRRWAAHWLNILVGMTGQGHNTNVLRAVMRGANQPARKRNQQETRS